MRIIATIIVIITYIVINMRYSRVPILAQAT